MMNSTNFVNWCIPRLIPLLLGSAITFASVEVYEASHQKPVAVIVADSAPAKFDYNPSPAKCTHCEWRQSKEGPELWTLIGPNHRVVARVFPDSGYNGYYAVFDGSNPRRELSAWGTLQDAKDSAEKLVSANNIEPQN